MPRHPRVHAEGLLYHVMVRGNDGQKICLGYLSSQVAFFLNCHPSNVSRALQKS